MSIISSNHGIIIHRKGRNLSFAFWAFIGILIFLAIWFPLYGMNLRYQAGTVFNKIFFSIGTLLLLIGGMFLVWGFLTIVCGRRLGGVKMMLAGFIVCYFGMMFINPAIFSIRATGKEVPQGYH